jgi:geranylgeranyl diphosphate synthase type I
MNSERYQRFLEELAKRRKLVYDFLFSGSYRFFPDHISDAVFSYMKQGGKSLRPAVLLFSCGAVGGDERRAIPAAAAIEVFHTWTLVHDDIIDRDKTRRGGPTVHEEFRIRAIEEMGYRSTEAKHYGMSVAMLAGDMQQGWAVSILADMALNGGVDPNLALYLIRDSEMRVLSILIDGELRDIQYSKVPIESLSETIILDMLWKKTGVLYEFAGKAGAMIGLNTTDPNHEYVRSIASFASKCGTAFQLQDDILGIVGDEKKLGKPVGSDIREGKRTLVLYHAYQNADPSQREFLLSVLGNPRAKISQIKEATKLLRDLGGVEYTAQVARSYITDALAYLESIPASSYKDLLEAWATYMIERKF